MMIDMHLHTKWSDGSYTVPELVKKLNNYNITHAILTDHDCICGNEEFKIECSKYNIVSTVGTELEAYYDLEKSLYLHLLCYNYKNGYSLNQFLEYERNERIKAIQNAILLLKDKNYNIDLEDVMNMSEGRHLLINHLCILLEKMEIVKSRYDAYNLFLNSKLKKQINYPRPTVEEIIQKIYEVGGIPVLAHPKRINLNYHEKEEYIKYLKSIGLIGIEAYYSFDTPKERAFSTYIAKKYGLIETVGSDWHCEEDGINFGNVFIPNEKEKILLRTFFNK